MFGILSGQNVLDGFILGQGVITFCQYKYNDYIVSVGGCVVRLFHKLQENETKKEETCHNFIICSSIFCAGGVASKVALLTPGMRIPALVTPVVSLGVATVLWHDVESEAIWELSGSDVATWTASGLALLAWLTPFIIPGIKVRCGPAMSAHGSLDPVNTKSSSSS
jgi:hypothetical protein